MLSIPLLKLMSADIAQQREEILSAAKREAEVIEVNAQKAGEQRHSSAIALVDAELCAMSDRVRGRAEAEAHMVLMTTKDTISDELLVSVEKELAAAATGAAFSGTLESLLAELMEEGPVDGVVLAPVAYVEQCKQWLSKKGYKHRVEAAAFLKDGVAIQDSTGTYRITNTLSARFEKTKSDLRKHCIDRLFERGVSA
jgi:vacuolar-type H+-ATPase subunit E/Vma4